jgi:hypothetical protein
MHPVTKSNRRLEKTAKLGLHNLYLYNDQGLEDELDRICNTNAEKRNAFKIQAGKQEGTNPLEKPRQSGVDNIKMDHR